jgi:hypothetical protein
MWTILFFLILLFCKSLRFYYISFILINSNKQAQQIFVSFFIDNKDFFRIVEIFIQITRDEHFFYVLHM